MLMDLPQNINDNGNCTNNQEHVFADHTSPSFKANASIRSWRHDGHPYEAALILETSADTRIIATDAINVNVAATAPIDRNGFFSTSRAHRSQLSSFSLRRMPRVTNKART